MKSLKRNLDAAARSLAERGAAEYRSGFVYRPGQTEFPVRNRRESEHASLRKVEMIAPEELRAAIVEVVTEHIGTDEAETHSSVAKRLGVSNTEPFRQAVRSQIDFLTSDHRLEARSGKLFAG